MENFQPHRGAFAYCSRGELGLITSETMIECSSGREVWMAWAGIHLSPEKFGQPWSSRTPRVVGEIRQDTFAGAALYVVEGRHFGCALLEL